MVTMARRSISAVSRRVLEDLERRNARLPAAQATPIPRESVLVRAISRRIAQLDPWEVDRARWGRRIADRRHQPNPRTRFHPDRFRQADLNSRTIILTHVGIGYLSREALELLGLKHVGCDVRLSDRAVIHNPEQTSIGDYSRIDDFCVLSGKITIGRNVHIAVFSNLAGGSEGIVLEDFSGLAYGCQVFTQSDDYSGATLTNPTVPARFKQETKQAVRIGRHSIVGTNSLIFPGVELAEGTSVGAMSVVTRPTEAWYIYLGNPARRLKARSRDLLSLEQEYLRQL
jgi:galactoside O-acetyltransferase